MGWAQAPHSPSAPVRRARPSRLHHHRHPPPPRSPPAGADGAGPPLDACGADGVTLIIKGGLRTESDFVKALALGADGIAVANSALQAIGCLGMRACHTNNCPVGIATQKPSLRARLEIAASARQLANFFEATVHLMQILARACFHGH
ncbi:MAG: hypothetical protein IIB09_07540, partial [Bacteroidetes bacterium]|nr:hypothetical protein [Bacteroidota bacterium]